MISATEDAGLVERLDTSDDDSDGESVIQSSSSPKLPDNPICTPSKLELPSLLSATAAGIKPRKLLLVSG